MRWIKRYWHGTGAGRISSYIGGAVTRSAATGLVVALCLVLTGMLPGQLFAYLWTASPPWLLSGWTRLFLLIAGLVLMSALLRFNIWSQQQRAVDSIAED